jgi:hypothetical protein
LTRKIAEIQIHLLADATVQLEGVLGEAGIAALVSVTYDDSSEFQFLLPVRHRWSGLSEDFICMMRQVRD